MKLCQNKYKSVVRSKVFNNEPYFDDLEIVLVFIENFSTVGEKRMSPHPRILQETTLYFISLT